MDPDLRAEMTHLEKNVRQEASPRDYGGPRRNMFKDPAPNLDSVSFERR
jgi:hypothetical protein